MNKYNKIKTLKGWSVDNMADTILKRIGVAIATKIANVSTELQDNIDTEEARAIATET